MTLGRGLFASSFTLLLLLAQGATAGAQLPVAVQGRMELATVPQQSVPLQGEWGFAWQQFVAPGWEQLPPRAFAPVPASWNDVTADGKPPGEEGWGSYVLQVDCPQ